MTQNTAATDIAKQRIITEQLHAHFRQLPAVAIAPALGALFTSWVLWDAVNTDYLLIGLGSVLLVSLIRLILYFLYTSQRLVLDDTPKWRHITVLIALLSGCIWGCMVIFLYPPRDPDYQVYMLVLLSLVPVAPVAAVAVYLPAFYAYYLPCVIPFVVYLAMQDNRGERLTAILLLMLMGATITFAKKYSDMLAEAIRLRLQLSDQKDSLLEAAKLKTRFMATASHDIRQPVHALGLFLESLRRKVSEGSGMKILQNMEESIMSLRRMLNAMLDISRLDAHMVEVNRVDFRLHDILLKLYDEYFPLALQKGLRFDYVPVSVVVDSDPALLERILRNLLSNAIKYTRQGRIILGCRRKRDTIAIMVCDSGRGIPATQIDDIFHEFTRFGDATYSADKSLGLGLSIVERLCRILDHSIRVVSKPGKGSAFSIEVPRSKKLPLTVQEDRPAGQDRAPDFSGLTIALIDDDAAIINGMQNLLQQWGARTVAGQTADEICMLVGQSKQPPDILIIDYHLAGGATADTAIREFGRAFGPSLPVLIITGDTSAERIIAAYQAGYILLHKPVAPERLRLGIEELIGLSKTFSRPNPVAAP